MTNVEPEKSTTRIFNMAISNFAATSAIFIACGIALSTAFLSAYLTSFDWRLIWFVDYPDVIRFGLIVIGIGSGSISIVSFLGQHVPSLIESMGKGKPPFAFWLIHGVFILIIVLTLIDTVREEDGNYSLWFAKSVSLVFILFIFLSAISIFGGANYYPKDWINTVMLILVSTWVFGWTLGEIVQDKKSRDQYVIVRGERLSNVVVVLSTSHHTIIYDGSFTMVVPTTDISRIGQIE